MGDGHQDPTLDVLFEGMAELLGIGTFVTGQVFNYWQVGAHPMAKLRTKPFQPSTVEATAFML
jgi:hypothetical protein